MVLKSSKTDQGVVAQSSGEQRASLLIYHREGVQLVPLVSAKPVTIGRLPPSDVQVWDRKLSRQHLRVELLGDDVWIEDLDSTNGTWINGERVERGVVRLGDEVTAGTVVISIHVLAAREGEQQGADSHDRFVATLEQEVLRARTFGRSLGVIMVQPARRGEAHVSRWCPRLQRRLRPVDRMGIYGADMIELVLPECTLEDTRRMAESIVGGRAPGEPLLLCGIGVFPGAGASAQELIEVTRRAAQFASPEEPVRAAPVEGVQVWTGENAVPGRASDKVVLGRAMQAVYRQVERLGRSRIPVLIYGETGTGKEVVARAIHERGGEPDQPLRCINCGAIPDSLIESVLFGHERGAFTGASQRAEGIFEAADGGTVLLDEVGELPAPAQAALLRVLDTKRVMRVGSSSEIEVDVRVLAATHRNLERMCEEGSFRWDLLYRLNAMVIHIPPLRDRVEEILPLAELFLREANRANGTRIEGIDAAAVDCLQSYLWPGNVRELRNVIERAVVIAQSDRLTVEDLSERVRGTSAEPAVRRGRPTVNVGVAAASGSPWQPHAPQEVTSVIDFAEQESAYSPTERHDVSKKPRPARSAAAPLRLGEGEVLFDRKEDDDEPASAAGGEESTFKERIQCFEAGLMFAALQREGWNQRKAARLLSMPLRTLVYKIKVYDLHPDSPMLSTVDGVEGVRALERGASFDEAIPSYEAMLIGRALRQTGGNQTEVSRLLRIPPRTLFRKIAAYGLRE